ncbi:hypothetical protein KXV85_004946, partial [Aspergillus fumigatus]
RHRSKHGTHSELSRPAGRVVTNRGKNMRFTVKAKLASAFGLIIILSMIAGGVAYLKLTDMIVGSEALISRANRMQMGAQIEINLLLQVRAEKNAIIAPENETDMFLADIPKFRAMNNKLKEEVYALASEGGKRLLEKFQVAYDKMNNEQDQTIKFIKTDRPKAADRT